MIIEIALERDIAELLADTLDDYNRYRASDGFPSDSGWTELSMNIRSVSSGKWDIAGDEEVRVSTP